MDVEGSLVPATDLFEIDVSTPIPEPGATASCLACLLTLALLRSTSGAITGSCEFSDRRLSESGSDRRPS